VSPQIQQLFAISRADIASQRPTHSLTVFLNCSPIYVVNRDDGEVDTMLADFKKSALDTFRPECIHVKTPEQAADLPAPAYM
jgi:quinate dehydrogenase